ncbi:MAG: hypothetical protein JO276_16255 [Sphingomonadaceae bacterium]|nr:hypothetical protein [Sphingomonadaceae bacterium]
MARRARETSAGVVAAVGFAIAGAAALITFSYPDMIQAVLGMSAAWLIGSLIVLSLILGAMRRARHRKLMILPGTCVARAATVLVLAQLGFTAATLTLLAAWLAVSLVGPEMESLMLDAFLLTIIAAAATSLFLRCVINLAGICQPPPGEATGE